MAGNADYIPRIEANRVDWFQNFAAGMTTYGIVLGIASADVTDMATKAGAAASNSTNKAAALVAYKTTVDNYDNNDVATAALARRLATQTQASPAVNDAILNALRLPIHSGARSPIPPPATEPLIYVSNGGHTKILIVLHDSGSPDAHSHAKPDGVAGIELWLQKNGTPPVDNAAMTSLGLFTKTRFTLTFDPTDVGKTFYFLGRWVNPTGEKGAWSAVVNCVLS